MTAQSGYNQALAQQQAQIGAAQSGVTQATSAVSNAQAALAVGSAPATAQEIAATEAAIEQDDANIATDKTHLAQAVLTAPFNGVISSINGSLGEVATSQGIRQPTAPGSVSQPSATGIQIFPQGPQNQTTQAPTYAALVSLESTQTKLVVQVPETDIHQIHTGQQAEASLPAVSGSTMTASVTQIQPTPVTQSGQTYFLVDLVTTSKAAPSRTKGSRTLADPPAPAQVGLTVDVSF
jgi:multidrug resistance efflux pump